LIAIPDFVEPLELWRIWRYRKGVLVSLNNDTVWPPGERMEAVCNVPRPDPGYIERLRAERRFQAKLNDPATSRLYRFLARYLAESPRAVSAEEIRRLELELERWHDAPDEACRCGIYGLNEPPPGLEPGYWPRAVRADSVLGRVKLWGRIVQGTEGARAQYAYPSALYVTDKGQKARLHVYGVPVVFGVPPWRPPRSPDELVLVADKPVPVSTEVPNAPKTLTEREREILDLLTRPVGPDRGERLRRRLKHVGAGASRRPRR
jgi:hypothetical protein